MNERIGITMEQTAVVLDHTGQHLGRLDPARARAAADAGRLADGDLVLLSGFGAGMTWASASIIRWGDG